MLTQNNLQFRINGISNSAPAQKQLIRTLVRFHHYVTYLHDLLNKSKSDLCYTVIQATGSRCRSNSDKETIVINRSATEMIDSINVSLLFVTNRLLGLVYFHSKI